MTLGDMLRSTARQVPRKAAVLSGDDSISYQDLAESSARLAAWMVAQGLQPGDRVALHWPNSIPMVQLYFAAFQAGVIAVPINLRLKQPEIAYVLENSGAVMCFSAPSVAPMAQQAAASCPALRAVLTELPLDPPAATLPAVEADWPAVIMYTSGTTARPKGVVHTHRSLVAAMSVIATQLVVRDDTALSMTSMMHAAALYGALLPAIYQGAAVAMLPGFDPAAFLDAVERYRVTYTLGLPALVRFVAEEQARQPRDVSSLRFAAAGGDTVPVSLQSRFQALFGIPLHEGYGMTESFPIAFNRSGGVRQGSMGIVSDGVEVRIVDRSGHELPDGEAGEVVVRSAANCREYWNNPQATAELFSDGWLHTGDLASRDGEGYFWFQGRLKQIIIRGGSNISPQEVEEALYHHPAVLETGVVGQPDPVFGEVVLAVVVLRAGTSLTESELREAVRPWLADYKLPERILFVAELPKGPTGKVDRRALKEMLQAEAAASAA